MSVNRSLRRVLGSIASGILAAAVAAVAQVVPAAPAAAAPDIVVFFIDDLGANQIGPVRHPLSSPKIDLLAQQGVTYTIGYAYPACVPARAALMSGRYPQRFGIQGNGPQPPGSMVTIAERLRSGGYATAIVGKWHLGFTTSQHPLGQGFDTFLGFKGITPDYYGHDPDAPLYDQRTQIRNTGLVTDTLGDRAVLILQAPRNKPLFLYVPFTGVHDPLQGTLQQRLTEVDRNVGRIVAAAKPGTIFFVIGDNGRGTNDPLRGGKYSIYEGGVRVPFIAKGPGFPAGTSIGTPVSVLDIARTVYSAATGQDLAGTDGYNLLRSVPADRPVFFDAFNPDPGLGARQGDWVFYRNYDGKSTQLYNVRLDPGQRSNVAASNPDVVRRLSALVEQYRSDVY
jgi:arylsulfatase A-like enzyme